MEPLPLLSHQSCLIRHHNWNLSHQCLAPEERRDGVSDTCMICHEMPGISKISKCTLCAGMVCKGIQVNVNKLWHAVRADAIVKNHVPCRTVRSSSGPFAFVASGKSLDYLSKRRETQRQPDAQETRRVSASRLHVLSGRLGDRSQFTFGGRHCLS